MVSAPYERKNKKPENIAVRAVKAYISKSILPTYGRFSRGRSHIYIFFFLIYFYLFFIFIVLFFYYFFINFYIYSMLLYIYFVHKIKRINSEHSIVPVRKSICESL